LFERFSFFGLFRRRRLDFWDGFLNIPKSLIRVCMFLSKNGNRMDKRLLIDWMMENNCGNSVKSCNVTLGRGVSSRVLCEDGEFVCVVKPTSFVIRLVGDSLLDSWRALVIPALILAFIFVDLDPVFCKVTIVLAFALVVGWFVDDYLKTVKF
jgi:hypothetical protein